MILKTVRVQNFKCIEDSTEFSIERVTCLVGKNESGKSALLQALEKLKPANPSRANFDPIQEYPRRYLTDYEEKVRVDPANVADVLTTTWDLEEADLKVLEPILGFNCLRTQTVTIRKGYGNNPELTIDIDEAKVVEHLLRQGALFQEELEQIGAVASVGELKQRLESLASPSERVTALLNAVSASFPSGSAAHKARELLDGQLPTFLYFPEYGKMDGRVAMDDLMRKQAAQKLSFGEEIFIALLALAGTTPEEIHSLTTFEHLIGRLEGVSNRLSREIFEYWSQNQYLKVNFRFDFARAGDPPPFNLGYIFRTRIENTRHGVTVGFDDRSSGFVWFFSFLVWFAQLQRKYGTRLIVLLDEPGLSLHGKAQEDLLRYINERLRPNYQVLYTTHSAFMVDPENILSVRTVEDVTENGGIIGTRVGDRVLSSDADTVFPLQAAMGYNATQGLFIGKHNLLVEGPSDLLYLKWLSQKLREVGRTALDARWTITPVGSIDKMGSFIALFGGNKLHVAVLTDFHEGDKNKVRSLKESKLLEAGHVFSVEKYAGQREADIEDLLGRSLYIALVNNCYALTSDSGVPIDKPRDAPMRVLQEVERHFAVLPPAAPVFDHYTPASYLIEHAVELRAGLPNLDDALDRFEVLFKDLNALLPRV